MEHRNHSKIPTHAPLILPHFPSFLPRRATPRAANPLRKWPQTHGTLSLILLTLSLCSRLDIFKKGKNLKRFSWRTSRRPGTRDAFADARIAACGFADLRMRGFVGCRMYEFADLQMQGFVRCMNSRIYRCADLQDVWFCGFSDAQICKMYEFVDLQMLGFVGCMNLWIFRCADWQDVWICGFTEARICKMYEIRGFTDSRKLRIPRRTSEITFFPASLFIYDQYLILKFWLSLCILCG